MVEIREKDVNLVVNKVKCKALQCKKITAIYISLTYVSKIETMSSVVFYIGRPGKVTHFGAKNRINCKIIFFSIDHFYEVSRTTY